MSNCIEHQGVVGHDGYGKVKRNKKVMGSHRWAYINAHGEPPAEYQVHHLCGNRLCINLDHLVALSFADHQRAHGWTPCEHENPERTTGNHCRECKREYDRERNLAKKAVNDE